MKRADKLAEELELGTTPVDYFNYIIDSLVNGQRSQVRELFNQMHKEDKKVFLFQWLEDGNRDHEEAKEICTNELF